MGHDWNEITFGELVRLQRGYDLPAPERRPGIVPVVGSGGINGYHDTALAKGPGLTIGRSGASMGVVTYVDQDYWPHNSVNYVTDFLGNDPRFVYYFLRDFDFQRFNSGSVQAQLNRNYIYPTPIRVPKPAEQRAISAMLGALDDKIELNRRMNTTLEAMARALFQSWFVDFDPVRAKIDGRIPTGLNAATTALFPNMWEESKRGKVPTGWRHVPVYEVCALNEWTLNKRDELDTLEYVEISEVSRGEIASIAVYARGSEPSRARRRLRHGDTVLSTVRPDRGAYFLALNPPENRVASTGFAVVTPKRVPWSFIHVALTSPEVSEYLGQLADGGAYPAVRPEVVGDLQVLIPGRPEVLAAFHEVCAPLFEMASANRTQSRNLAQLRDTLLPLYIRGDLKLNQGTK